MSGRRAERPAEPPGAARAIRWLWPTLLLAAIATLGLGAHIAEEIGEGDTFASDSVILLALRQPGDLARPVGPYWLLQSATDLSALGGFTVLWLLGAAAVAYLLLHRRRFEAAWLALALIGASLIDAGMKGLFHRARPEVVPHLAMVSTASFPSGHAMISAAAYLSIGLMLAETDPRPGGRSFLMAFACLLTVLIGASRVYLGVHWPSDVVAGWCFGSVWALVVFAGMRWLRRRVGRGG